jgi:metal-responsive CopG/Arc/MetJ family transcriptional regulator
MRTTIAIDEKLVEELMRVEPGVSRSEAMRKAVEE